MRTHHLRAACLGMGLLLSAATATAQEAPRVGRDGYREGMPGVIVPPRPVLPPETPFEAAYRRAGYPRMILFFNRVIADTATSGVVVRRRDGLSVQEDVTTREEVRPPRAEGNASLDDAVGKFESVPAQVAPPAQPRPGTTEREGRARVTAERTAELTVDRPAVGAREAPVSEAGQWMFESGFTSRLTAEKARLVDRATAMRLATSARADDPQRLETAALRGFADVAVVVRGAPSEGGVVWRMMAIDTRNGRVLADALLPPSADLPLDGAGVAAAQMLMARLTAVWPAR